MAKIKLKVGDTVRVIAGAEKDSEGKITAIDHKNHRVTVEGVHMVKKHMKPSMANQNGGIIEIERPIDISNVMLLHGGQTTRIGIRMDGNSKVRYAKKTGETIDVLREMKK